MEKKFKIYSSTPSNLPSNIEIRQLNSKADELKLIALFKKVFNNQDYLDSLIVALQNGTYNAKFGAFLKDSNTLVGGCLLVDKSISAKEKYNFNFPLNHTMLLDFLFVDPQLQHSKIGTNLINCAYEYCGQKGFKQIELLCEIENSLTENVYDKADMLRTGVASISNLSTQPHYFIFNANVNQNVRQFGKVLYLALIDAFRQGDLSYYDYKERLQDGFIPADITSVKNIDVETFRNIVQSKSFDLFDEAMVSIVDSGKPVMEVTDKLNKILKIKKQGLIPYTSATHNGLEQDCGILNEYLTDDFTTSQVATVKTVLTETKNRLINDYILQEYTKK